MALTETPGYGVVAKILHWLIFVLLAVQYAIGSIMPHIGRRPWTKAGSPGTSRWAPRSCSSSSSAWSGGCCIRLPQLPTLAPWEKLLFPAFTHWALYLLVLAMTLLGWAATNSRGWDVKLFGLVTLPQLAPNGSKWGHEAGDIHNILVYVLLGFIALHVTGALYHYFVKHDRVCRPHAAGIVPCARVVLPVLQKKRTSSDRSPRIL